MGLGILKSTSLIIGAFAKLQVSSHVNFKTILEEDSLLLFCLTTVLAIFSPTKYD